MRHRESDDVYRALVSELAYNIVPMFIVALTILTVGLFGYQRLGDPDILPATVCGIVAALAKVPLHLSHRRAVAAGRPSVRDAARWERAHAVLTWANALCVAWLVAMLFTYPDVSVQMLATTLLFGYAAGVASRVAARPLIAATTILISAIPPTIAAVLYGETAQQILAAIFVVYMLGSMQNVWHVYQTAVREIRLRLEMEHKARHDPLTGLRNRTALADAFGALGRSGDSLICVHCFDLDGFKFVNDRFGHAVGDELLAKIGKRLRDSLDQPNVPVRVGGDEFVVLQPDVRHPVEADIVATTIVEILGRPYLIAGEAITVGISLGYTLAPSASADIEQMLPLADAASYRAKRRGGGIDREVPSAADMRTIPFAA